MWIVWTRVISRLPSVHPCSKGSVQSYKLYRSMMKEHCADAVVIPCFLPVCKRGTYKKPSIQLVLCFPCCRLRFTGYSRQCWVTNVGCAKFLCSRKCQKGMWQSVTEHFKTGDAKVICMRCQNSQTEYSKHGGKLSENWHRVILSVSGSIIDKKCVALV